MTIKPEIGMPVLYWSFYAVEPTLAFIGHVHNDGRVYLYGPGADRVELRQGSGNENEIGTATTEFCEFPQWFIDVMRASAAFSAIPRMHMPQVIGFAEATVVPFVQPTSQVLG